MILNHSNDRNQWDAYLPALRELLRSRRGPGEAITLDQITQRLGLPHRRAAEQLMEDHIGDLGFAVVAGSPGLWRPGTAAEINAYRSNLHKRHVALRDREDALVNAALKEGWSMLGDEFSEPPQRQPELFSMPVQHYERSGKGTR